MNELEKRASKINNKYRKKKEALILKVPVPIIMTRKGLIAQQSTVDYTGLINGGTYIAFDAKETLSKTSFPLANIKQHQLVYLELVRDLGGIAFFFIHFKNLHPDQAFITPIYLINHYWSGKGGRKSIPISDFKSEWLAPVDNYLPQVKQIYAT